MQITKELLEKQLASLEMQEKKAFADMQAAIGAQQVVKHLLGLLEQPEQESDETPKE